MDNIASSVVKNTKSIQPSLRMPIGMGDGAVDNKMPECDEDNHGVVFHAISETSTNKTSRNNSECELISAENGLRNGWC